MSQFQAELFGPFCAEVMPLLMPRHYEEMTPGCRVPLAPDWERYAALDRSGMISLVTMREEGKLVGYSSMIVASAMHSRDCLEAYSDFFWVVPEMRGRMGGLRLFRTQEKELRQRGVKRMNVGSRLHQDASRLFAAMGYSPYEKWFTKWID